MFATAARSGIEFGWPIGSALRFELKPQKLAPQLTFRPKPRCFEIRSTKKELASTPMASAPSSATITPRFTFPRTSPAMYAEYWNPMNWNSRIESMNGKTVVEKIAPRKSCVGPGRNAAFPEAAILSAVTPPV